MDNVPGLVLNRLWDGRLVSEVKPEEGERGSSSRLSTSHAAALEVIAIVMEVGDVWGLNRTRQCPLQCPWQSKMRERRALGSLDSIALDGHLDDLNWVLIIA